MDDFSGQIINQWKYEHFASFLISFFIHYTFFSEKMEKSTYSFKYIIQIALKTDCIRKESDKEAFFRLLKSVTVWYTGLMNVTDDCC